MLRVLGTTPDPSLWEQLLQADWFWGAVAAMAAVAALVGSLTTVIVNAISRHRNRPEPDWSIVLVGTATKPPRDESKFSGAYSLRGTLMNVGDGVAHNVRFVAAGQASILLSGDTYRAKVIALIRQGDSVDIEISIRVGDWSKATFTLEWTDPPTRLKKRRSFAFRAGDYMERPGYSVMDPKSGKFNVEPFEEP